MGELIVISDEYEKKLHPEARKIFHNWTAKIQVQVQLDEVTDDELNFLSDYERIKLKRSLPKIPECLKRCIDIEEGDKLYDVHFGDIFFQSGVISKLKRDLLSIELDIVPPLKKIYEGRVAKAEEEERKRVEEEKRKLEEAMEEQRKREDEEKREAEKAKEEQREREVQAEAERREKEDSERLCDAYIAIKPPMDDAKKYLKDDEEFEKFERATWKAVDVYMEKGKLEIGDGGSFDYRQYLIKINNEKEKERRQIDAEAQAQAFAARLAEGLKEIERNLSPKKEDPAVRFRRWCSNKGENRYLEESFTDILVNDADRSRKWTQGHIPAAEEKLQKSIPGELRDFILTEPTAAFFLLPSANFLHCGVPCLDFYFAVFAVVTITVSAQAGSKKFNGIPFNFLTNLREPKLLGSYQIIITPNEPHFWQSVPISIIHALIDGNLQPPGTTILERTDQLTVYEVRKFEEDICAIPISFERYCRSLGSFEKMRELGIIKERTAEILELPRPISINHKESKSKKEKAFELFDEGKRPSDSEVKSLGIKPNSTYRYYQDWKRSSLSDIK